MFTHRFSSKNMCCRRFRTQNCAEGSKLWSVTMRNSTNRSLDTIKSIPRSFSPSQKYTSIWLHVWDGENRLGIVFVLVKHQQGAYWLFEHVSTRLPAKYGGWTPPRSNFPSTPMCDQTISKLTVCLCQHRFGCSRWNTGISALILLWQSCIWTP